MEYILSCPYTKCNPILTPLPQKKMFPAQELITEHGYLDKELDQCGYLLIIAYIIAVIFLILIAHNIPIWYIVLGFFTFISIILYGIHYT